MYLIVLWANSPDFKYEKSSGNELEQHQIQCKLKLFNLVFCPSVSLQFQFFQNYLQTLVAQVSQKPKLKYPSISHWHKALNTFPVLQDINYYFYTLPRECWEGYLTFASKTGLTLHSMDSFLSIPFTFVHIFQVDMICPLIDAD